MPGQKWKEQLIRALRLYTLLVTLTPEIPI